MTDPVPHNKVVLVTGGARRLGAAICRELHHCGCCIVLHYRKSEQAAQQLATELNGLRQNSCVTLAADLSDGNALSNLVTQAIDCWGGLDCLVNSASAFFPTPVADITEQQWHELMTINAKAPLFLAQASVPELKRRQGCIINIVDIHAERPMRKHPVYSASKSALAAITRSLARELAPEIRVNGVAPGAILWPENDENQARKESILQRIPLQRTGEPDDIARAVRFLMLEAPYITGQILAVDGGRNLNI